MTDSSFLLALCDNIYVIFVFAKKSSQIDIQVVLLFNVIIITENNNSFAFYKHANLESNQSCWVFAINLNKIDICGFFLLQLIVYDQLLS